MSNKNTFGKFSHILLNIWIGVCLALGYRFSCFTAINGITVFQSKLVFWALILVLIPLGTLVTFKKRRNFLSVLLNSALPIEIYTMASTCRYIPKIYTVVLVIASVLSIVYFSLVVFKKVKYRDHIKKIIHTRIKFATLGVRTIVVVLLLVVTVPICVKTAFGYELLSANVDSSVDVTSDEWSLKNNIQTVSLLHEDTWLTLSLSERLDVLAVLKNVEMRYFGINHEVYLEAGELDEGTVGCYDSMEHRITIDINHLMIAEPDEVMRTLLHECMHVYQRMCVALYNNVDAEYKNMIIFDDAKEYREEFSDYTNGDEDMMGYYLQKVEVSARDYADYAAGLYLEYIADYLAQPNGETPAVG